MTETEHTLPSKLLTDLQESWDIHPYDKPNQWIVYTPFTYSDGDHLKIVLVYKNGKWTITDQGYTVYHFFVDEFDGFRFKGFKRIDDVLAHMGLDANEKTGELTYELDDEPTWADITSFILALERFRGAALTPKEGLHGSCRCCTEATRKLATLADLIDASHGWEDTTEDQRST